MHRGKKSAIRTKSDQNKITIRLKLVPHFAKYKESKTALRLKSDQHKITIRLK